MVSTGLLQTYPGFGILEDLANFTKQKISIFFPLTMKQWIIEINVLGSSGQSPGYSYRVFPLEYGLVFVQSPFKRPRCQGILISHNKISSVFFQASLSCLLPFSLPRTVQQTQGRASLIQAEVLLQEYPLWQARNQGRTGSCSPANLQIAWKWDQEQLSSSVEFGAFGVF